jgi:hypothetical protein
MVAYGITTPKIFAGVALLNEGKFDIGGGLFYAGIVILFALQLVGLFFSIMVVHPVNVHGPRKMWKSITEKTGSGGSGSNRSTGPVSVAV